MRKSIIAAALLLYAISLTAQIGVWHNYLSYHQPQQAEDTGNYLFVLASNSLYQYNRSDQSIVTYDKTNGMSDVYITSIAWNSNTKNLIAIYRNGNIDIVSTDGDIVNLSDYYMKTMTEDKTVNSVYIYDKYAYLSTNFGIVKVNMAKSEISETYNLGFKVNHSYIEGDSIYAASQSVGIYSAPIATNLLEKSNWTYSKPYVDLNKTIDDNTLALINTLSPGGPSSNNFYHLYLKNNKLYSTGGIWNQIQETSRTGEVHLWDGSDWSDFEVPPIMYEGAILYQDALCLDIDNNDSGHAFVGTKNGLYEFQNGKFVELYNQDNSIIGSPFNTKAYSVITSLKYDETNKLWLLNALQDNSIKSYSESEGWNTYAHEELKGTNSYDLEKLFISEKTSKMWFVNNYYANTILYCYDYHNDILDSYGPTLINQDGTTLSATYIYSPVEDADGNIWVGTDIGPLYLPYENIENGEKTFVQYKVPRNDGTDLADYLLSGVDIRAIAIDGGNRKWIGTSNDGVYLISSDNNTQIAHFTSGNSPLLSNSINDIVIDGNTGMVYFATEYGLCSYTSDATNPNDEMSGDNVYAYPNPVTPSYTGLVAIVGLSNNADVKIVTQNGALVNEGKSVGGTYTWDCCDKKGKRVASGVYMVETATSEGGKGTVCKIAVIR